MCFIGAALLCVCVCVCVCVCICVTVCDVMVPGVMVPGRRALRQAGYTVLLCDESYTSKRCSVCRDGSEMSTFRAVPSPRPWRVDNDGSPASVTRWGLVRCNHEHGRVSHLCCRDANSVRNIRLVAIAALGKRARPAHLLATPPPPPAKKKTAGASATPGRTAQAHRGRAAATGAAAVTSDPTPAEGKRRRV
jgi:hypothetical protein